MPIPSITLAPIILCAGAIAYKRGEEDGERAARHREEMTSSFDFGAGQQGDADDRQQHSSHVFVPTSRLTGSDQTSAVSSFGLSKEHRSGYPRTTHEIENSGWLNRTARSITGDLGPIEHVPEHHSHGDMSQTSLSHEANRLRGSRLPLSETKGWVSTTEQNKSTSSAVDAGASSTTRGWFWGATKDDAGQSSVVSAKKVAQTGAAKDSESGGWFWERRASADDELKSKQSAASSSSGAVKDIRSSGDWLLGGTATPTAELKGMSNAAGDSVADAANGASGRFRGTGNSAEQAMNSAAHITKDTAGSIKDTADGAATGISSWLWGKKAETEMAVKKTGESIKESASGAADVAKSAADSVKDSVDETASTASGWFWNKKATADQAVQETTESVQSKADDAKGWFWTRKAEADKTIHDTNSAIKDSLDAATDDAKDWLSATKSNTEQSAKDAVDSVKSTADSARGWFWSKKADADKAAQETRDSVKDKVDTAADSVTNTTNSAKDWLSAKKRDAERARQDTADPLTNTASEVRGWMSHKADEAKHAAEDVADSASASYNSFWKGDQLNARGPAHGGSFSGSDDIATASKAFASASGFNAARDSAGGHSRSTSDPGGWGGSSATHDLGLQGSTDSDLAIGGGGRTRRLSASDAVPQTSLSGGVWTDTAAGGAGLGKPIARKDSLMSSDKQQVTAEPTGRMDILKDNSVLRALDGKFNEARSMLLETTSDIKAVAVGAGSAASGRIRAVAEKVSLPSLGSTGTTSATEDGSLSSTSGTSGGAQGIVASADGSDRSANHQYRFVEVESHIPLLSSKSD